MNTEELIAKAQELEGQTIVHDGKTFEVKKVKKINGNLTFLTDSRTIVVADYELAKFLKAVEKAPIPQAPEHNASNRLPVSDTPETFAAIYQPTPAQTKIQDSLLAMLAKVQADPAAIPQAKAVCDIANTMVNMERTQIQAMQFAKSLKK